MEAIIPIIIQVISGLVGGGAISSLAKSGAGAVAMSILPRLLAGGLGGIGGAQILAAVLGSGTSGLDLMPLISNIGGGVVGGGVLTGLAGAIMSKSNS